MAEEPEVPEKEAGRPGEGAGPARAIEASPSGFPSPFPARSSGEEETDEAKKRRREAEQKLKRMWEPREDGTPADEM